MRSPGSDAGGVTVLQRPQPAMNGQLPSAFIQAPDGVELELVEGDAGARGEPAEKPRS